MKSRQSFRSLAAVVFWVGVGIGMISGCSRADEARSKYQGWDQAEGRVLELKALTEETPSVANTFDYQALVQFEYKGEKRKLSQRLTEHKANLLSVGQDVAVHVNPGDLTKSEIELPVPYPDKSGMNWRRMPRNLTTAPATEIK